jgi:hypothetical protein
LTMAGAGTKAEAVQAKRMATADARGFMLCDHFGKFCELKISNYELVKLRVNYKNTLEYMSVSIVFNLSFAFVHGI